MTQIRLGVSMLSLLVLTVDNPAMSLDRISVRLPPGIALWVEPETSMCIERIDPTSLEISLSHGRLLASVDPQKGASGLTVRTRSGSIIVEESVFSIASTDKGEIIKVFRGAIKSAAIAGTTARVTAGTGDSFIDQGRWPPSPVTPERSGAGSADLGGLVLEESLVDLSEPHLFEFTAGCGVLRAPITKRIAPRVEDLWSKTTEIYRRYLGSTNSVRE